MTPEDPKSLRQRIADLFEAVDTRFDGIDVANQSYVLGRLHGGSFANHQQAWVKSDDTICNVSSPIGSLRTGHLAVNLLKLNFKYPLGRVSAVELASRETFVVCETMFFIRSTQDSDFRKEIQQRITAFLELRSAAQALYDAAMEE